MLLLEVFGDVMLPLLLLASLGALVGRRAGMPARALSVLVFNLFTPALVFSTLIEIDVNADLVPRISGVVVFVTVASCLLGLAIGSVLGRDREAAAATALSTGVMNLGNMGLPVSALAFGGEGLAVGVVAFVTGSVVANSFGIFVASIGGGGLREAAIAPLKVPAIWAIPPALLVRTELVAPGPWLLESADLLAGGAVPLMLVVLGLQAGARAPTLGDVSWAVMPVGIRLLVGPLLAWAATLVLGVGGVAQKTLIVLGGMPAAVIATIIAARHDVAPDRVARTVMLSTILSFVTLTVLIGLLR